MPLYCSAWTPFSARTLGGSLLHGLHGEGHRVRQAAGEGDQIGRGGGGQDAGGELTLEVGAHDFFGHVHSHKQFLLMYERLLKVEREIRLLI